MSQIPMDVVRDIFSRLPAKSLVRFRCLSKPHCALIDCPDFVKDHLDLSLKTGANRSLLLRGTLHLYSVDFDSLDTATEVDHPLKSGGPTEVFGSCNGLIGLSNSLFDLALYNLSTRKIHRLPVSPVDHPEDSNIRGYVFYGFGYDSVNDDYKVLRMVQFKRDEDDDLGFFFPYEVKVYSLKNDSWRKIKTVPGRLQFLFYFYYHLFFRRGYGVLAGNNLHWVMPQRPEWGNDNVIFGFDLGDEKFHSVPQPDYGSVANVEFQMDLGVLDGCLCLVCNYGQEYADIWVMKEYGVKESWTKLFKIQRPKTVSCFAFLRPLTYSQDGGKVLLDLNNRKLVWYDMESKKLSTARINGAPDSFSAEMCMDTLLPAAVGNEINRKKQRDQEEKKIPNRKNRDGFLSEGFKLVL